MLVFHVGSAWVVIIWDLCHWEDGFTIQPVRTEVSGHWEGLQGLSHGCLFHLVPLCSVQARICFSVYVHTSCKDGVSSFEWQARWPHWSLQMVVWPPRCSSPLPLLYLCLSPSAPPRPACSYLSQWKTLTEKGTWLLAWGRSWILEFVSLLMLHSERLELDVQFAVFDKQAACLPPIALLECLKNKRQSNMN